MKKALQIMLMGVFLCLSVSANAELWDRGGGLIYDDVLNITWLQNANLAATENFGVSGIESGGLMDWGIAVNWVAAMNAANYLGYSNWRLPQTLPVNGSHYHEITTFDGSTDRGWNISAPGSAYPGSTGSEMAYMYYNNLGNLGYYDTSGNHQPESGLKNTSFVDGNGNTVQFQNLQPFMYWSGTMYNPTPDNTYWMFYFDGSGHTPGMQYYDLDYNAKYVWAVRDGDVGPAPVLLDIKPGIDPNTFNCNNENGVIDVAILTTEDFDATTVDHTTVTFEGASETHVNNKSGEPKRHEEDVDGDGDTDLVFHFHIGDTNLTCESTVGTLTGETSDGMPIQGTDSITSEKPYECYAGVPQTGQTTCYDENGNAIGCAGTAHDGDLQMGTHWPEPRFTINGDGTVTDNMTGLRWLQNANCFGRRTWTEALSDTNALSSGSCGLSDGSSPGDWRLPNVKELHSLIHWGVYDPAVPDTAGTGKWKQGDPFWNVFSGYYWSSTTRIGDTGYAYAVDIGRGSVYRGSKSGLESVWAVRGGELPE